MSASRHSRPPTAVSQGMVPVPRAALWTSASEDTLRLGDCGGDAIDPGGLTDEGSKRREVVIPFDQRRARTEAAEGIGVKLQRLLRDADRVGVDQDLAAAGFVRL